MSITFLNFVSSSSFDALTSDFSTKVQSIDSISSISEDSHPTDLTLDLISMPNSERNFLHIAAAATLAAVSLALALSKTFLESL